jgi:hypothetical protein
LPAGLLRAGSLGGGIGAGWGTCGAGVGGGASSGRTTLAPAEVTSAAVLLTAAPGPPSPSLGETTSEALSPAPAAASRALSRSPLSSSDIDGLPSSTTPVQALPS